MSMSNKHKLTWHMALLFDDREMDGTLSEPYMCTVQGGDTWPFYH